MKNKTQMINEIKIKEYKNPFIKEIKEREDKVRNKLMDKIVDMWNYYVENERIFNIRGWESKDIANCVHRIQGIIAISECKSKGSKLFK